MKVYRKSVMETLLLHLNVRGGHMTSSLVIENVWTEEQTEFVFTRTFFDSEQLETKKSKQTSERNLMRMKLSLLHHIHRANGNCTCSET